jgi:dihydropteroate synthase
VNDVSGGTADPEVLRVVADAGAAFVAMHMRGNPRTMQQEARYADVVREVGDELRVRIGAVVDEGVDPSLIIVDPGLGFAKRPEHGHNWTLLAHLAELRALGHPVLVAASRKRFLGRLLAAPDGTPRPFTECDDATVATTALAAAAGAWCVRVHKVRPNADAVRVAAALNAARGG